MMMIVSMLPDLYSVPNGARTNAHWTNAHRTICSPLKWCTRTFAPPNPPLIDSQAHTHTHVNTCTHTHTHTHVNTCTDQKNVICVCACMCLCAEHRPYWFLLFVRACVFVKRVDVSLSVCPAGWWGKGWGVSKCTSGCNTQFRRAFVRGSIYPGEICPVNIRPTLVPNIHGKATLAPGEIEVENR